MLQTQLRYVQTVLTFGIFITIFLNNNSLIIACFVGLALAWQLELLLCELRTDNNEFIFILLLLSISFIPVLTSFLEIDDIKGMIFLVSILIGILYLIFNEISISTFGSSYLVTVISFYIISFCVSNEFIENLDYLTFLFLILFFIKTLATFFNIQFSNYQYFFNFDSNKCFSSENLKNIISSLDNRVQTMNNDLVKLDALLSHVLNVRPNVDRFAANEGKEDARRD